MFLQCMRSSEKSKQRYGTYIKEQRMYQRWTGRGKDSMDVKDRETKTKRVYVCLTRVWRLSFPLQSSFIPLTTMSNTRSQGFVHRSEGNTLFTRSFPKALMVTRWCESWLFSWPLWQQTKNCDISYSYWAWKEPEGGGSRVGGRGTRWPSP